MVSISYIIYAPTCCFCIRNLTCSICQQLLCKYRTPALSMKYSLPYGLNSSRRFGKNFKHYLDRAILNTKTKIYVVVPLVSLSHCKCCRAKCFSIT